MTISAILPYYNEKERILPVISAIKKSKKISEIIIVDDGSEQSSKDILASISGVTIITHPQNLGKSQTLKSGVVAAKGEHVFFIDTDLTNLQPHHVDSMIVQYLDNHLAMILSERENEHLFNRLNGFAVAYTGERILSRQLLINNINIFENQGYLIEPAINQLIFHKHKVGKMTLRGVGQVFKIQKGGLKHWINDFKMVADYIRFLGATNFINQLIFAKSLPNYS